MRNGRIAARDNKDCDFHIFGGVGRCNRLPVRVERTSSHMSEYLAVSDSADYGV